MRSEPADMTPLTVYLNSAGATNAANIMMALRRGGLKVRIIAGDMDRLAAGLFLADKGYVVPPVASDEFLPALLDICRTEKVDVALPVYSADFPVFARHRQRLESEGIRTYAPSPESLAVCDDKVRVIEAMSGLGVSCPRTWSYEQALERRADLPYPLMMKRRSGSGSRGIQKLEGPADLDVHLAPEYIVQEYLDGEEYTVDAVSDLSGRMLAASPRLRAKIYGGLSVRGVTVADDRIVAATRTIVEGLGLVGPSNVQCKRTTGGELKFFEVNPRFASGGLPLAVAAGLNGPEILLRLIMGWEVPPIRVEPGVVMIRYWESLFVRKTGDGDAYALCD
ncbi:MAG: hypothetical protein AMXMBFR83_11710 [Phycisphaerae bacterium]